MQLSAGARAGEVDRTAIDAAAARKLAEIGVRTEALERTRAAIETLLAADCFDPAASCPVVSALPGEPGT